MNVTEDRLDTALIAQMNDDFRTGREPSLGKMVVTSSVAALGEQDLEAVVGLVRTFDSFTEGDNGWGERDFGKVAHKGIGYMWKIDYYDMNCENGAEDPTDPTSCTRVLTIMEDY
jgi:hypothetical protein